MLKVYIHILLLIRLDIHVLGDKLYGDSL